MFEAKAKGCANGGDHGAEAVSSRNVCECERCRAGAAHDAIERVCRASEGRDPIEIALAVLRQPEVRLHGAEHRFVVAGSLLAAAASVRGDAPEAKARALAEARVALESSPGRACACEVRETGSVAHAAGLFGELASGNARTGEQLAAAAAKLAGQIKGDPCCKRNAFLSILQACHFAREHLGVELHAKGPACEWHPKNRRCILAACPFYRPAAA